VVTEPMFEENDVVRSLRRRLSGVEIWPDTENPDTSMRYVWVVHRTPQATRTLAYLRSDKTRLQVRSYDADAEEVWSDVPQTGPQEGEP
jgi:hypothetical protein